LSSDPTGRSCRGFAEVESGRCRLVHELSIAQSILETAVSHAECHNAARITRIRIRVGRLRQVVPALLADAFDLAKRGTLAAEATLDATYSGMRLDCAVCGRHTDLDTWAFECPNCGSADIKLDGGDELELTSLDLEIPDDDCGLEEEHPGGE
jgi:hydrogenase nickel incorporation protein HypA/HybF